MNARPVVAFSVAASLALGIAFAGSAAAASTTQDQTGHDHASHQDSAGHGHASHDPAATHEHAGHHPGAAVMPVPADHVKWEPDAPLMEGMQQVRSAMKGLHHHEMGHLDETQVDQLATQVDEAVAYMFANCELPAEPDVALHGVLARLMAGAEALHADPADPAPVAGMQAALEDYPKLFDDPAFAESEDDHAGH